MNRQPKRLSPLPPVRVFRDLRIGRRMTIKELSRRSGVAYETIRCWESGRTVPSIANFEACLNVMDATLQIVGIENE